MWLLKGGSLPERIRFLYDHGFRSMAKLQSTGSADSSEARDAAQLIRELGMTMTCHTNVQANLKNRRMDPDFARRALEDDLWWYHATGGALRSCCSDVVSAQDPREILLDDTVALAEMQREIFGGTGVLTGIENATYPEYCHRILHIFLAELSRSEKEIPTEKDLGMDTSVWIPLEKVHELPEINPSYIQSSLQTILSASAPIWFGTEYRDRI